jgi:hypothetical protein
MRLRFVAVAPALNSFTANEPPPVTSFAVKGVFHATMMETDRHS